MEPTSVGVGRRVMDPVSNEHGVVIAVDGPRIGKKHVSIQMETGQVITATPHSDGVEGFKLMPIDGNEDSRPSIQNTCHQSTHKFEGTATGKREFWRQKCSRCGIARMALEQMLGQSFPLNITGNTSGDSATSGESLRSSDLDHNGELKKPVHQLISGLYPSESSVEAFIKLVTPRASVRVSPSPKSEKRTQLMRRGEGDAPVNEYDRDEHGMLTPLWVVVEMPGNQEPSNEIIEGLEEVKYTPLDGESDPNYGGEGWPVPPIVGPDQLDIAGCYVFRRTWI